jgi:hypothetical protein
MASMEHRSHRATGRRLTTLGAITALLFLSAGAAQAVSIYAELSTSDVAGDFTARADLTASADPFDVSLYTDVVGAGLGSALVSGTVQHTHTFAPDTSVAGVVGASLLVSVLDDFDFAPETAEVSLLDNGSWAYLDGGNAFLNLFGGDVTAKIQQVGDSVTYELAMTRGDTKLLGSALLVKYREGEVVAGVVPEPTAALLFAAGVAVVSRRRRAR